MRLATFGFILLLFAGCTAPAQGPTRSETPASAPAPVSQTLTLAFRFEPPELALKIVSPGGTLTVKDIFGAGLAVLDGHDRPQPRLAEALPQLNTDSWRVFPDGRMETTYTLRPSLTWHDGQALTSDDFVFAWRVYTDPRLGVFSSEPQDKMSEVEAIDPRTVVIRWRVLFSEADRLADNFAPLPRHLLSQPFEAVERGDGAEAFMSNAYWSTETVGAGPYKLERWTPGTSMDGVAFDGYGLGRPKISRVLVRFMGDENAVLASMLAGDLHIVMENALFFEHFQVLRREWEANKGGEVLRSLGPPVMRPVQHRADYLKTRALSDIRIRRALAHAINRDLINEGTFEGQAVTTDIFLAPAQPYFADVNRVMTHYPFDPRRSEQVMGEAGFTKDRDGFFANAAGERFRPDV
jgi:peptide/nickel transport system substrate-binding protein